MKLILTVVIDVDTFEEAKSKYRAIEENWIIASAKLDGQDYHPSLYKYPIEEEEEEEEKQELIRPPNVDNPDSPYWNPSKGGPDPYEKW